MRLNGTFPAPTGTPASLREVFFPRRMANRSVPRCNEAGCNSGTDGSFRSLQFLHFHFQPPDKLSGRCLHRRYFSLMPRWAGDWRRRRRERGRREAGWGGGALRREEARTGVPIKCKLNGREVNVGKNRPGETVGAPWNAGPLGNVRVPPGSRRAKKEKHSSPLHVMSAQANWPNLAPGGTCRALAVSGGGAGGVRGDQLAPDAAA